jgi:hypothetical protein
LDDPYSHEAYEAWWRDHGGGGQGYSLADHAETRLRCAGSRALVRRFRTLFELYDFFAGHFGDLLAAEAFRRALQAHAARLPAREACTKPAPSPEHGDAPERC